MRIEEKQIEGVVVVADFNINTCKIKQSFLILLNNVAKSS